MEEDRAIIERLYRRFIMEGLGRSGEGGPVDSCPRGLVMLNLGNFREYIRSCRLAVIDFYADWCLPCKVLEPIINKLTQLYSGKVLFGRVDVGESPEIANAFNVMSIPTIVMLRDGEEVYRVIGVVDIHTLRRYVELHLGVKPNK